jgi:protein-L-isoaspartate(D-aspartate) O-methyltransferase
MVREQLYDRGIRQRRLLHAFLAVPRHLFVDPAIGVRAYEDCSLPIGFSQTVSQPYTIAFMIQSLELRPTLRVLEIGTGSGYQTAILSLLARNVYSIERHSELSRKAEAVLTKLGTGKIRLKTGDGLLGWRYYAPYDRIIVSAATSQRPDVLLGQLADGGALIAPVQGTIERLTLFRKEGDRVRTTRLSPCAFVPMQQGVE